MTKEVENSYVSKSVKLADPAEPASTSDSTASAGGVTITETVSTDDSAITLTPHATVFILLVTASQLLL